MSNRGLYEEQALGIQKGDYAALGERRDCVAR